MAKRVLEKAFQRLAVTHSEKPRPTSEEDTQTSQVPDWSQGIVFSAPASIATPSKRPAIEQVLIAPPAPKTPVGKRKSHAEASQESEAGETDEKTLAKRKRKVSDTQRPYPISTSFISIIVIRVPLNCCPSHPLKHHTPCTLDTNKLP